MTYFVFAYNCLGATWRSGYAPDCKSVDPGSIPGVASKTSIKTDFNKPNVSLGTRTVDCAKFVAKQRPLAQSRSAA